MPDRFATLRAPHPALLFVAMLTTCLLVQWVTWDRAEPFDGVYWADAGRIVSEGTLFPTNHFIYGYPATSVVGMNAVFIRLGLEEERALEFAIGFWYALFASISVVLSYLLRPKTAWWALTAWAFLLQSHVFHATPPSSAIGPMLTAFALLVMWAIENKKLNLATLALIGITGGVAAVTRLDLGGMVAGSGILALSIITKSFRVFLLTSLIGIATFCALNPYMWSGGALEHLSAILGKIGGHADIEEAKPDGVLHTIISASFLGFFTFLFALTAPLHRIPLSLIKSFLIWACAITAALLFALSMSAHHPVWIFYPALLMWEIFLPLFAISAIPRLSNILKMNPAVLGAFLLGVYLTYYILRYYFLTH